MGSYLSGKRATVIPDETLRRVEELRADGLSWEKIQHVVGVTSDILRRRFGYSKPERSLRRTLNRRLPNGVRLEYEKPDPRVLALVPRDTRSMQARFFGDPLPGRSALDAKQSRVPANQKGQAGLTFSPTFNTIHTGDG